MDYPNLAGKVNKAVLSSRLSVLGFQLSVLSRRPSVVSPQFSEHGWSVPRLNPSSP